MKFCILLVAVAACIASNDASVVRSSSSRLNLNLGVIAGRDRLLYRTYVYQQGRPNTIQYQDVNYRGNYSTRISAIRVNEVGYTQYAVPTIISGGIGWNNVVVRITSARGYGYYYQVEIWGQ